MSVSILATDYLSNISHSGYCGTTHYWSICSLVWPFLLFQNFQILFLFVLENISRLLFLYHIVWSSMSQLFNHNLSKHFMASAKNNYLLSHSSSFVYVEFNGCLLCSPCTLHLVHIFVFFFHFQFFDSFITFWHYIHHELFSLVLTQFSLYPWHSSGKLNHTPWTLA